MHYSSCFSHALIIETFTWLPAENMTKFQFEILSKCDSAKLKGFQPRIKTDSSMAGERENEGKKENKFIATADHICCLRGDAMKDMQHHLH